MCPPHICQCVCHEKKSSCSPNGEHLHHHPVQFSDTMMMDEASEKRKKYHHNTMNVMPNNNNPYPSTPSNLQFNEILLNDDPYSARNYQPTVSVRSEPQPYYSGMNFLPMDMTNNNGGDYRMNIISPDDDLMNSPSPSQLDGAYKDMIQIPNYTICRKRRKKSEKKWRKMSSELFREMLEYERMHPDVRQNELQSIFNVNRSTYWRWKKKYMLS